MKAYFKHTPLNDYFIPLKHSLVEDGVDVEVIKHLEDVPLNSNFGIAWGIVNAQRLHDRGVKNVLVMERGYLSNREEWLSLGWNGLNGKANFNNSYVSSDRWKKYWQHNLKPWAIKNTNRILVCGQVLHDKTISDCDDYNLWLNTTINDLQNKGYDVLFRPHPLEKNYNITIDCKITTQSNIIDDFNRCDCVVVWSSTVANQAVYNGIPAVTFSKFSMAYDVTSHSIDDLTYTPNREAWGIKLAYTMWNKDELMNGTAWNFLRTHLINFINNDY